MTKTYKKILIVLGAPPLRDGRPSNLMVNRVRKAVQLCKKNKYAKVVFSGGPMNFPAPSAEIMRVMSMKYIPHEKILVENNSKDLLHNAIFCWELIKDHKPKKITIITSNWNLPRTRYIFKKTYKHMNVTLDFKPTEDNIDAIERTYLRIKELFLLTKLKFFGIK
ncbi:YdcF family protein [Nanoarchaeota archaeon]